MNMFTLQTLAAKAEQSGEDLGGFMSPERLEIAGQVVLIGMGMVFAGAAAEDDEELVAALTAAVAAAIASDEELSSRFASGFRVVSFKKAGR